MIAVPFCANAGNGFAFYSVFVLALIYGLFNGICQSSIFQMSGSMPPKYIGAIMAGQGIAGLGSNLLRAATLEIWPNDDDERNGFRGCLAMFIFGAIVMVICAMAQLCLRKNTFSKFYLRPYSGYRQTMDATPIMIRKDS